MPKIHTTDTLKTIRETLCVAMTAVGQMPYADDYKSRHVGSLQRLCDQIDRQRPLGPDGKHGDRHTPTCGCCTPTSHPYPWDDSGPDDAYCTKCGAAIPSECWQQP